MKHYMSRIPGVFKALGAAAFAAILTGCETFVLDIPDEEFIRRDTSYLADNREVIAIVNSVDSSNLLEHKAARRGFTLNSREVLTGLDLVMLSFTVPAGLSTDIASSELEKLEPHATAGANHKYTLQSQHTRKTARLYADSLISWPESGCRASLPIGMIDGGIDMSAPTLKDAHIISKDFTKLKNGQGAIEHGTAIAELLVGPGRLKEARLYNAVVIPADDVENPGSGVGELLQALNWMQSSGVRVVNISLAGPYNKILDRAVQRAVNRGLILVAAVGNNGATADPQYPAAFKEVIAATAVDSDKNIYDVAVRGQHVDFAAPGVNVFIEDQARYISGTSIAAPFVSARIISDKALVSLKSAAEVKSNLAIDTVDLGVVGPDAIFGKGLIKAGKNCVK